MAVVVLGDFTDKYGNEIVDDAVRITINMYQFQKYICENLVGLSLEQQLAESTDEYYVHPAVLLEVNPSKLHLETAP